MEIAHSDKTTVRLKLPILIALLVVALFMGPFGILAQFDNSGVWTFMPVVIFIVALESIYTTIWLANPARRVVDKWVYRLGEIVLLAVILRFVAWMSFGGVPDEARLTEYLLEPASFFDSTFIIYLFFGLFAWIFAVYWSSMFIGLALHGDELAFYQLPPQERKRLARNGEQPIFTGRPDLYTGFAKSWLMGGMVLIILMGLATLQLPDLGSRPLTEIGRLGLPPLTVIGLLLYFFIGIWLLSHARYQVLSVRWTVSGTQVDPSVERRWHRITTLILLAIGAIAAFMPIGSSFALQQIVQAIVLAIMFIGSALMFLFTFLLTLPFLLFRRDPPEALENVPPPAFDTAIETAAPVTQSDPWVMGAFFWAIVAVAVITILLFYLRERGYPINNDSAKAVWHGFVGLLRSLWQWIRARTKAVIALVPVVRREKDSAETTAATPPWRFMRVNSLSPREQVRFYYLAAVRRAQERGVTRKPSETPLEYNRDLIETWPDAENDVEALTEAFLHARYSPDPVAKDEAGSIKQTWKRVRSTLRKSKADSDQSGK
jgi:hypothetical protein